MSPIELMKYCGGRETEINLKLSLVLNKWYQYLFSEKSYFRNNGRENIFWNQSRTNPKQN